MIRTFALLALLGVGAAACSRRDAESGAMVETPPGPEDGACRQYDPTRHAVGTTPAELSELSGLAASHTHPGIWWAHNDSGNAAELFAIRETGEVVARFPLAADYSAKDAEDVAVGPCQSGDEAECIYLADIGDNLESRPQVRIFVAHEPAELRDGPLPATVLTFTYPDGPHNAEALILNRKNATLYVLTKTVESLGDLYRIDRPRAGEVVEAVKVGPVHSRLPSDHVSTAADLHPDVLRLLIRTYDRVWELRRAGATTVEELLGSEAVEIPGAPGQPQSEAIAWSADGRHYLIGSEGKGSSLVRIDCRD
ncbi:MAG: hypothetical protein IRZ16_02455 [Myxococcaceae bacterium]|nr:hypothetical protein [Myxococcaceae bacterium]